uniref:Uncharacterized protein n=1 Tax=Sphaerodactylus townsendi TaxID=933632 RepID=A0ACB8FYW7_9SAUR
MFTLIEEDSQHLTSGYNVQKWSEPAGKVATKSVPQKSCQIREDFIGLQFLSTQEHRQAQALNCWENELKKAQSAIMEMVALFYQDADPILQPQMR